jgi:hypothetical protein
MSSTAAARNRDADDASVIASVTTQISRVAHVSRINVESPCPQPLDRTTC